MWEKERMGEEREGKGCFVVSWLVNHTPLQEMQHQRLQYQTMPNGMCTASITNDIARLQSFSFFLRKLFNYAAVMSNKIRQKRPWPLA